MNTEGITGAIIDRRYKIENLIGVGGMAVVYRAYDLAMHRTVAIKILKADIATDETSVQRFINESKAVAMLNHPNIVAIYDVSVKSNLKYIVMEHIEGITLKNYMTRKGRLSFSEIMSYTGQVLQALEHAHNKGITHRDIKPQNIMLLRNGTIKVMDFGIAKLPQTETLTMADKTIGTVYYVSPEQASGTKVDWRSDIYSLGVMLYEMCAGRLPFEAENPISVALMHVKNAPVPPRQYNPQMPVGLEQIILHAMEKERDKRYQSAGQMLKDLQKLRSNPKAVFRFSDTAKQPQKEKPKKKKPHRASHSMFPIILGVVLAFIGVAGISGYYTLDKLVLGVEDTSETVTIPNFLNTQYTEELQAWFAKSEYYTVTVTYEYSSTAEAGTILEQTPIVGERRKVTAGKNKCNIALVVCRGAEMVTVPDLVIYDYRIAEQECKSLGLVTAVEKVYSDTYEVGTVIRIDPEAGTELKRGASVKIYASLGPAPGTVVVPAFKNLTEIQAMKKVISSNLRVGQVTYEKNDKAAGTVLSQSLTAYTQVQKNTTVDFVVSGGPTYGDVQEPAETTAPPAETTDNPAETTAPPAETTAKPAESTSFIGKFR